MSHTELGGKLHFDEGSFRDRTSRVLIQNNRVFRVLDKCALDEWNFLNECDFFKDCINNKDIVQTTELSLDDFDLPEQLTHRWEAILEHKRIPFISYPYEWSFTMLKDAALLQLDLIEKALKSNMILKDASSYNIQWQGTKPIFIDTGSFVKLPEGCAWHGYRQFCELFLFPLMLQAYKNTSYQPWLRGSLEGISAVDLSNIFSFRDKFRPGVLMHVVAQAALQNRYDDSNNNIQSTMKQAGFKKELISHNISGLKNIINKLQWKQSKSTWSNYTCEHNYTDEDMNGKTEFVRSVTETRKYKLIYDLGCNTGVFSRIAAEGSDYVVAVDFDALAIDHLYQSLKLESNTKIQPLIGNIADPSPGLGWRNQERKSLTQRSKPDLVMALALIHHLVIGSNIPLDEAIQWFWDLGGDLLIEFVDKQDSMTKKLLLNKEDNYSDYTKDNFEALLKKHYSSIEIKSLSSGNRTLYLARRS